jgi:hypothetical protein
MDGSQMRISILKFYVAIAYLLITTILLAENIFYLVLSFLIEASPHVLYNAFITLTKETSDFWPEHRHPKLGECFRNFVSAA